MRWAWIAAGVLVSAGPLLAQSAGRAATEETGTNAAELRDRTAAAQQGAAPQAVGFVHGMVADRTGVGIAGATVRLAHVDAAGTEDTATALETQTAEDGSFVFQSAPAGPAHITVTAAGFATRIVAGSVRAGESLAVPQIALTISTAVTEVHVSPPIEEIAQEQLKEQEKQRALGVIPNFYVSYVPDAAPLSPKQKFQLAYKWMVDPVTFGITGAVAGLEQWQNQFSGYGQGASGYGKRYGAAYADSAISTMIGGAILPSLLKQDPRYFYKGTGSKKSRLGYAVANAVICKGDNGKWQANYSGIIGSFATGGISNLYYPSTDRGASLTVENALISIGAQAAANVLQEFVLKKFTTNVPAPPGTGKAVGVVERMLGFSKEGGG